MPLLRPKQSLRRSVRRRGTGRPPGLDQSSNGRSSLPREGRAPSRPVNQLALITRRKMGRHGGHPSPKNDIHFGGLQSLAAAEPNKGPPLGACLVAAKQSLHRSARRRGTGRHPDRAQDLNTSIDPVARKCYRNGLRVLIRGKEAFAN